VPISEYALWKIAPALACGNTVVIKPASNTALSLLKFAAWSGSSADIFEARSHTFASSSSCAASSTSSREPAAQTSPFP